MSEIRRDPLSQTWTIMATERGKRPSDFARPEPGKKAAKPRRPCPFCGEGEMTEPVSEFAIWPGEMKKGDRSWLTRVLGNRYPALRPEVELNQGQKHQIYHWLSGVGGHEVIVESPHHDDKLKNRSIKQMEAVIRTYCQRYKYWRTDPRMAYVLIFKNYGEAAGASLSHPHSQLVATPIIPPRLYEELEAAKDYYEEAKECIYCAMIKREKRLRKNSRKVFENKTMIAFCPFASRFPCEMIVLPKRHSSAFEQMQSAEIKDLAEMMCQIGHRMDKVLHDPPFNYLIHVGPLRTPGLLYYHWHIEVIPKLTTPAGFEWATDIYINIVSPKEAAKSLREAKVKI